MTSRTVAARGVGVTLVGAERRFEVQRAGVVLGRVVRTAEGRWRPSSTWTADGIVAAGGAPMGDVAYRERGRAVAQVVKRAQQLGHVDGPPAGWVP